MGIPEVSLPGAPLAPLLTVSQPSPESIQNYSYLARILINRCVFIPTFSTLDPLLMESNAVVTVFKLIVLDKRQLVLQLSLVMHFNPAHFVLIGNCITRVRMFMFLLVSAYRAKQST